MGAPHVELNNTSQLLSDAAGDSSLLVNTLWGSSVAVTAVSLTGQVTRLSPPGRSRAVIATTSTRLYASGSSLASLPCAYTLELAGGSGERRLPGPEAQNQWKVAGDVLSGLGLPADAKALLQDISVTRRMSGELSIHSSPCAWLPLPPAEKRSFCECAF